MIADVADQELFKTFPVDSSVLLTDHVVSVGGVARLYCTQKPHILVTDLFFDSPHTRNRTRVEELAFAA